MLHAVNWWTSNNPKQRWEVHVPDEEDNPQGVDLIHERGWSLCQDMDGDAAYIAQFAPEMAEYIMRERLLRPKLHYEYAVQVLLGDGAGGNVWHFADEDSLPFGSLKPYEVRWYTKKEAQEILGAEVECFGPKDIRIVRRLVAAPEVVE